MRTQPAIKNNTAHSKNIQVIESIKKHLGVLLNTKNQAHENAIKPSILNYGTPSLSHFNPSIKMDSDTIMRLINGCIKKFEPRIKQVSTQIIAHQKSPQQLTIQIKGALAQAPSTDNTDIEITTIFSPKTQQFSFGEKPA